LQPQCGVYLLILLPSFFTFRPGDCLLPGFARIARLPVRWQQFFLLIENYIYNLYSNKKYLDTEDKSLSKMLQLLQ
jgi:hypothetical protein